VKQGKLRPAKLWWDHIQDEAPPEHWNALIRQLAASGTPRQLWAQMVGKNVPLDADTTECLLKAFEGDLAEQKKVLDYLISGGQKPTLESLLTIMEAATQVRDHDFLQACEALVTTHREHYAPQVQQKLKDDPEARQEVQLQFKAMLAKFGQT